MALTVKRITLWRVDVENVPGVLANTLEPLAAAGVDLRLVMGYRFPNTPGHSAIEVAPLSGKRATEAAHRAGLTPSDVPCLLVEGEDRPGLGARIGRACAEAGINLTFLMAIAIGRRFAAAVGLPDEASAKAATAAIKRVGSAKPARRRARRR
jgi:hypothetical protein